MRSGAFGNSPGSPGAHGPLRVPGRAGSPAPWTRCWQCWLQWWVCRLQIGLSLMVLTTCAATLCILRWAEGAGRASWIPMCCDKNASHVLAYAPTDFTFMNFTLFEVAVADSNHLAPDVEAFAHLDRTDDGHCPDEHPHKFWHKCFGNGTYISLKEPERSQLQLAWHTSRTFLAGVLLGATLFLLTCCIVACFLPHESEVERQWKELGAS